MNWEEGKSCTFSLAQPYLPSVLFLGIYIFFGTFCVFRKNILVF